MTHRRGGLPSDGIMQPVKIHTSSAWDTARETYCVLVEPSVKAWCDITQQTEWLLCNSPARSPSPEGAWHEVKQPLLHLSWSASLELFYIFYFLLKLRQTSNVFWEGVIDAYFILISDNSSLYSYKSVPVCGRSTHRACFTSSRSRYQSEALSPLIGSSQGFTDISVLCLDFAMQKPNYGALQIDFLDRMRQNRCQLKFCCGRWFTWAIAPYLLQGCWL